MNKLVVRCDEKIVKVNSPYPFQMIIGDILFPAAIRSVYGNSPYWTISADYAWYYLGEQERKELDHSLSKETNKEVISSIMNVLNYRSLTRGQVKWLTDINKGQLTFPQSWNLTGQTITFLFKVPVEDFRHEFVKAMEPKAIPQAPLKVAQEA